MNKSVLAAFAYRLFVGVMFWGTVPLSVALFVWEHDLAISDLNHKAVQLILVFLMTGWASVWNTMGEYHRISHYTDQNETLVKGIHYHFVVPNPLRSESMADYPSKNLTSIQTHSSTIHENYHVSNN